MSNLKEQLQQAIEKCSGIFGEYKISDDNDYLLVEISSFKEGIFISADFEKPTFFSGDVRTDSEGFYLPFEPDYFEDLQYYLEQIQQEIMEGYLLPNNLYLN